jgi:hypothetical protein
MDRQFANGYGGKARAAGKVSAALACVVLGWFVLLWCLNSERFGFVTALLIGIVTLWIAPPPYGWRR